MAKQFLVTGRYRHVLVIGAELLSKYLDWTDRSDVRDLRRRRGSDVVMSRRAAPRRAGLGDALRREHGRLICMPGGGALHPPNQADDRSQRLHFIQMKGNETFKIAVRAIEEVCREVLDAAGLTPTDVDWFVPHQANQRIIDAVGTRLGLPEERCYVNIERYGNTSAASIPIALDEAVRRGCIARDHIVLMAAFGAGLTWAASVVRW